MALPQYQDLIDQLTQQKKKDLATADARAQGEAQRRGLVNQTGTSDIESSLRGNAAAPIENAYTGQIAQLLGQQAQTEANQAYQTGENQAQRQYQTSERVGSQQFQTGENQANRQFQTQERLGTEAANTASQEAANKAAERQAYINEGIQSRLTGQQQTFSAQQADLERQFQDYLDLRNKGWTDAQIKAANRGWWQPAVGTVGAVAGGTLVKDVLGKIFGLP